MGHVIREGRGKVKTSEKIITDDDARELMTKLLMSKQGEKPIVKLSTGDYMVETKKNK